MKNLKLLNSVSVRKNDIINEIISTNLIFLKSIKKLDKMYKLKNKIILDNLIKIYLKK
jgi:hypothetical protein